MLSNHLKMVNERTRGREVQQVWPEEKGGPPPLPARPPPVAPSSPRLQPRLGAGGAHLWLCTPKGAPLNHLVPMAPPPQARSWSGLAPRDSSG